MKLHSSMQPGLVVLILFLATPAVRADKPIPVDTALPIIEALEGRIQVAEWDYEGITGSMSDPLNMASIRSSAAPGAYNKRHVIFEPPTGRYRVDSENVLGWVQGVQPFFAAFNTYSFDGRTERFYEHGWPGTKLPSATEASKHGVIRPPDSNKFFDEGDSAGIGFFPPYYFNRRFSVFLRDRVRQKFPLIIQENERGIWSIETLNDDHERTGEITRIEYDPVKGVVLGVEWLGKPDVRLKEYRGKVSVRRTVSYDRTAGDIWIPRLIFDANLIGKTGSRAEYKNVRVNHAVDESKFRFEFPNGTRVRDDVEKKSYKVTGGAIDEQAAIREFMRSEELHDQLFPKPWYRSRAAIVGLALIPVVLIAGFVGWRWRRKRLAMAAFFLIAFGASPATAADLDADGNWVVEHAPGERIRISHCGLDVSIFALEYFHIDYQLRPLVAGLPPTEDGIRLSDIKTMLEAHGLEVTAREKVTLSDLKRVIRPGTLALFPVKLSESSTHYLIAVRDPRRGTLLVDSPREVRPLDGSFREADLASRGGVVLFVRRPATPLPPQASRVTVSPELSDLGTFRTDDPATSRPIRTNIVLANPSPVPVMVNRVITPCGCMRIDWPGGCLRSGEQRDITVTIIPNGWGMAGRTDRSLTIEFQDGSVALARLTAENVSAERLQQMKVSPNILALSVDGNANSVAGDATVYLDNVLPTQVSLSCSAPWLRAELQPETASRLRLHVTAAVTAATTLPIEGEITLASKLAEAPIVVRVTVAPRERYKVEPASIRFSPNEREPRTIVLVPLAATEAPPSGCRLLSAPDGLRVERRDRPDGSIELSVRLDRPLPKGHYLVRCQLGTESTKDAAVRFVVHVADTP